jgi:superfamily I DNA/RNA helicase
MLCTELEEATREGYSDDEIVILSPVVNCAAAGLEPPWRERVRPLEEAGPHHIRFTTISAFKGLEAPFVLVSDLIELESIRAQALLYIACTRPVERLTLLMRVPLKDVVARVLSDLRVEVR